MYNALLFHYVPTGEWLNSCDLRVSKQLNIQRESNLDISIDDLFETTENFV